MELDQNPRALPPLSDLQEIESTLRELNRSSKAENDLGWLYDRLDSARSCLIRGMLDEYRAQLDFSQAIVGNVKNAALRRSVSGAIARWRQRASSRS
ncbi:MAG TPA: hypothetical protein VHD76_05770 [Bryobacteraceae bacterium]|jgi:hypothetical protein|nr:hypothetical protein [Bryobacteraceae bacterium]